MRRWLDLTQAQLADVSGLHRNLLGSIEIGGEVERGIATIACVAHGVDGAVGSDEPPLLPLLAQTFTGQVMLLQVRLASPRSLPGGQGPGRPPSGR